MSLLDIGASCRRCGARAGQECFDWCSLRDDEYGFGDVEYEVFSDADPGL
ncbi:hypothetical protein [Nonomuraea basaltis]|nr:hypothetical protein [Nonomuraea basaltis]